VTLDGEPLSHEIVSPQQVVVEIPSGVEVYYVNYNGSSIGHQLNQTIARPHAPANPTSRPCVGQ
jgi:hypothetical protein